MIVSGFDPEIGTKSAHDHDRAPHFRSGSTSGAESLLETRPTMIVMPFVNEIATKAITIMVRATGEPSRRSDEAVGPGLV
jgi:hypothetical protein